MSRIRQSFCLRAFWRQGVDVAALVRGAGRIGYAAVEIWDHAGEPLPLEELVATARDAGMVVASMGGHGTLTSGLNDPRQHGRIADELAASIELAVRHGIPNLICFSGNREGRNDEAAVEACAAGLRRVAPLAEQAGVNLNMELLNSRRNHPDYQADHTAWGVRVCEAVGSPRVKLLYDIYHMQIMEGDVIATIRANIGRIGHFHTAGNPGRGPLDANQELNYPAICRAIAETGYTVYVAHEFWGKGEPLEMLAAAYRTCDMG